MNYVGKLAAAFSLLIAVYLSQNTGPLLHPQTPPLVVLHHEVPVEKPPVHPHRVSLIQPGNLHFLFDTGAETLKVYSYRGNLLYRCPGKNVTASLGFLHWGACPHGTFRLGRTVSVNDPRFGRYFTPLYDLDRQGPMHQYHRTGIGLHAGGSRLLNPFSAYQRLLQTHGCVRVSNCDQVNLVHLIHTHRARGHVSYITIQ